jgi:hypothetical protein
VAWADLKTRACGLISQSDTQAIYWTRAQQEYNRIAFGSLVEATRANLMKLVALPYKVSESALSSSDPDSALSTDSDPSLRYLNSGLLTSGAPRLPSRYSPFHHPSLRGFRRQRRVTGYYTPPYTG